MASNTDLLKSLTPGMDLSLMADAGALEAGKTGLLIVSGLLLAAALYLVLTQLDILGGLKKTIFAWLGAALALGLAFLTYQKHQLFSAIDPAAPLLTLSRQAIAFPQKQASFPWAGVEAVEMVEERRLPKQATQEIVTRTVRLRLTGPEAQSHSYYDIDYEPLNVDPALLAGALENYRKGL